MNRKVITDSTQPKPASWKKTEVVKEWTWKKLQVPGIRISKIQSNRISQLLIPLKTVLHML